MLPMDELTKLAEEVGFSHVGHLDAKTIELKPQVRQMCADNSCGMYGKRWSCPPGCGTLEECAERLSGYTEGILVQTVGELEDELDGEAMMETEAKHKENFLKMLDLLRKQYPNMLPIGSGCCRQCKTCTYPDAPCRFPEKRVSSMEAYGMLVLEVCKKNDMQYYYGPCTISYTSCFLLK